jgi:hypothetical protein
MVKLQGPITLWRHDLTAGRGASIGRVHYAAMALRRAVGPSDRLAVALLVLLVVPFLGAAHKIDDPLYLRAARQVLAHPLDPLGGPSFWHERPATFFLDLYNPPLIAYLLALPVAIDGGGEITVHVLMLAIGVLALLACSAAGESWGVPRSCTLLLAVSPALCVSAVSAMTDLPFLLFCALAWGLAGRGRGASAGVAVATSALTKYVGLLNLPLALLALRRPGRRGLAAAAMVAALFGAYCAWSVTRYGALHVRAAGRFQQFGLAHQAELAASFVASLGLVGLPAALGVLRWSRGLVLAALASATAGAVLLREGPGSPLLALVAFGAGGALLAAAGLATRRVSDPFLHTAFWGFALYSCVLVYFGTARYLLPMLPPLMWLLVRGGLVREDVSRARFAASVAVSAVLAVVLLRADAAEADLWRRAARALPSAGRGFQTGRWGFDWYASERGYRPLPTRERLREGDVVAEPSQIHTVPPTPAQAAVLAPRSVLRFPSPWLRVMDAEAGAGYYSSGWGPLPLGWRAHGDERVAISAPDPDILAALEDPVAGPVVVDMGTGEATHVQLDGWSAPEEFTAEDGTRRTFVWAVGSDAALRLPLPAGVHRVALRVSPAPAAVGPLRLRIGDRAHAVVDLTAGWRSYSANVEGRVSGGVTDVVLQPAGHERPGLLTPDRRELSIAVDVLVFGEGDGTQNRGRWPVRDDTGRPRLFVSQPAAP